MTDFSAHPTLESLLTLHDAAVLYGLEEAVKREFNDEWACAFTSMEQADDRIARLDLLNLETQLQVGFFFAPPYGVANPMEVVEIDDEAFTARAIPVLGRVAVQWQKPINLPALDAEITGVLFNCTQASNIQSYLSKGANVALSPMSGEFDSSRYRTADENLRNLTPLSQFEELAHSLR